MAQDFTLGHNKQLIAIVNQDVRAGAEECPNFILHCVNHYDALQKALEFMVYAFPGRIALNNIFDGYAASAIWQAWNVLGKLKPRYFDEVEFQVRNEKFQRRADFVLQAIEEKLARDRAARPQYDSNKEQREAFESLDKGLTLRAAKGEPKQ
jgi:hypothetical protein